MDSFTETAISIKKQNAEIINNLSCINANQIDSTELQILAKKVEVLFKSQIMIVKQIEQTTGLVESLKRSVNTIMDELNGKYKFI